MIVDSQKRGISTEYYQQVPILFIISETNWSMLGVAMTKPSKMLMGQIFLSVNFSIKKLMKIHSWLIVSYFITWMNKALFVYMYYPLQIDCVSEKMAT